MSRKKPDAGPLATDTARASFSEPDRYITQTVAAAARTMVERCRQDAAAYAQLQPEKALLTALAVGYALRVLPTTRILGGFIHLGLALVKPAALVYGVAKLSQKFRSSAPHGS